MQSALPALLARMFCCFLMTGLTSSVRAGEFPAGSPRFATTYQDFLAEQKRTGKPGVIVFSAPWCSSCQEMKRKIYPAGPVKPYHDQFVWAYLNVEDPANFEANKKYQTAGLPHLEFLNAKGQSVARLLGKKDAKTLAAQLSAILPKTPAGPR